MSSYNGELYIEEQVKSIFAQKVSCNIHLLIRDDGSNDNTVEIIENLQTIYPNKIDLIKGENVGYNASYFALIRAAEGHDLYAFSDQDDIWLENKLSEALKIINKNNMENPLLYGCASFLADNDLKILSSTRKMKKPISIFNSTIQNIFPGHNQIINNELLLLLKNQPINLENIYVYDSWILNIAVLYGQAIFNNNEGTLYRQHSKNSIGNGTGIIKRYVHMFNMVKKGDSNRFKKQIVELIKYHSFTLAKCGALDELTEFTTEKNVFGRIKYAFKSKLYRQSKAETFCFLISYILGK